MLVSKVLVAQVGEYVKELLKFGVVMNAHIVIAVGVGLVITKDSNLLVENGNQISLEKFWARYLLSKMWFVKQRASTKSQKFWLSSLMI